MQATRQGVTEGTTEPRSVSAAGPEVEAVERPVSQAGELSPDGVKTSASQRNIAVDVVLGAVAGAAGVWVMDPVGWFMYDHEDPAALAQEHRARPGGRDVAHAVVAKVGELTGTDVSTGQPSAPGLAVHYGLGMVPGALYAIARNEVPALRAGNGALYGFGLFAMNDEVAAPLLGVASGPRAYPWQAHVRGLVAHVVLGIVTESVLKLFDRLR
jgi:hypothetical protein